MGLNNLSLVDDWLSEESSMDRPTLEVVEDLARRADNVLTHMRDQLVDAEFGKTLDVRYKAKDAAEMAGRSYQSIHRLRQAGEGPSPQTTHPNGRTAGYTLAEVNELRALFDTFPERAAHEEPVILSVQNFKGGVGKSTVSVHLAQYLAQKGYRVLLIDADSQASATSMFGFNPDQDFEEGDTLLPVLIGDTDPDLTPMVRATYWERLDMIPSCLALYNAEYLLAAKFAQDPTALNLLHTAITDVASNYDVVIMDPPPALGMVSLSVTQAANAVVVPTPPNTIDFSSTSSFLSMMTDVLNQLPRTGRAPEYKFIRFILTKADLNKGPQEAMRNTISAIYGDFALPTALLSSVEYDTAALTMRTLYEQTGPKSKAYQRARRNMDQVFSELELVIRGTWPSHRRMLAEEGRV